MKELELKAGGVTFTIRPDGIAQAREIFETVARWHAEVMEDEQARQRGADVAAIEPGTRVLVHPVDEAFPFLGVFEGDDPVDAGSVLVRVSATQPVNAPGWSKHPLIVGELASWSREIVEVAR